MTVRCHILLMMRIVVMVMRMLGMIVMRIEKGGDGVGSNFGV